MKPQILVTRPAGQADELCRLLVARNVAPIVVPTVAIETSAAAPSLDAMISRLPGVDWLVLTSANGALALAARLVENGHALPRSIRIAAVGPATADALTGAGIRVDHVPDQYLTVAIADGLGDVDGRRVVLARADTATSGLHDALVARGAIVDEVIAYRTIEGPASSRDLLHAALQRDLDGIAFTSGSTVRGLIRLASPTDRARVRTVGAYCIGPVTAAEARQSGFHVAAIAREHTAVGLADAIAADHARVSR
jgi:uroporphyrinogen-III synthase